MARNVAEMIVAFAGIGFMLCFFGNNFILTALFICRW